MKVGGFLVLDRKVGVRVGRWVGCWLGVGGEGEGERFRFGRFRGGK